LDPVRSEARRFTAICLIVIVLVLGLFEAIAHRGQGPDAPGANVDATTAPATPIPAPGQP
jgi:hypothetical protein